MTSETFNAIELIESSGCCSDRRDQIGSERSRKNPKDSERISRERERERERETEWKGWIEMAKSVMTCDV